MQDHPETSGKQVIARAAAVLKALGNDNDGLNVAQLTRATSLPRTTVHRIVTALQAQQMVSVVENRVYLGPALTRLAGASHINVVEIARPHIEALGRSSRETIDLSVLRGNYAVLVDQVASDRELRVVTAIGTALPLYCTAHGKALLAAMPDSEVNQRLQGRWESRTPRTVACLANLRELLGEIRLGGIATDIDEHLEGVCGIGITLATGTPERYALSIVVPSVRFDAARTHMEASLRECAAAINACFA